MTFEAEKYKNLTDSITDLIKRENDLLQKASQADGGSEKRLKLIEQLSETTQALSRIEGERRMMIKDAGNPPT
jgi:hypothetical protein